MYRPITTKQHSILDYVSSLAMPFIPKLLGGSTAATAVVGGITALTAGQTAMTDYEGGKYRVLPMQAHLANDALVGVGLLGAALLMKRENKAVRGAMLGLGLVSLAAAFLTQPIPKGRGRARALRTAEQVNEATGGRLGPIAGA